MNFMKDISAEKIEELLDKRKKSQILRDAIKEIRLTKASFGQYLVSLLIAAPLGILISGSNNTIQTMQELVEWYNGITLALVAMVIGSYAIFQALLNRNLFSEILESNIRLLKESNRTFLNLTILYAGNIIINTILKSILCILPEYYFVFLYWEGAIYLTTLIIIAYLFFCVILILEIINFTINLYRMFSIHNTLKALDILNDDSDDNE